MLKEIPRWLYWTPRILSILFAVFLFMFSFDVYTPGMSAGQVALGFLMHNIPVMILAVIIAFAIAFLYYLNWKRKNCPGKCLV